MNSDITQKANTPKEAEKYKGQFIVFFSEDREPEILFSSFIAEEAYLKAEEIKKEKGREPVVYRVQETENNLIKRIFL